MRLFSRKQDGCEPRRKDFGGKKAIKLRILFDAWLYNNNDFNADKVMQYEVVLLCDQKQVSPLISTIL